MNMNTIVNIKLSESLLKKLSEMAKANNETVEQLLARLLGCKDTH